MKVTSSQLKLTAIFATLALGLFGCATGTSLLTGESGYYGYTWEQEKALGRDADKGILQEMGAYPDDALADYVETVGRRVLEYSVIKSENTPEEFRNLEFTFRVLDSPVVNAFALPGGYVYVTRGLLAHVESEAQLAVVLGHEITHVAGRHASQQAWKQQIGQIGLLAGAIIGEQVYDKPDLAKQILDVGGGLFQLVSLKYGRDAERESDQYGVESAAKAGYDASEGSAFFRSLKRISNKSGQSLPFFMSTHPDPGEREGTIQRQSQELRANYPQLLVNREEYMAQLDGIVVGENPRHGFVEGHTFFHPDLAFQFSYPNGWQLQNQSAAVFIADPSRKGMLTFSLSPNKSPAEAAKQFVSDSGLTVTRSDADGSDFYLVEGTVATDSGLLGVSSIFSSVNGRVGNFLGYCAIEDFPAYSQAFSESARSFRSLRDKRILSIQPSRLSAIKTKRQDRFENFLPQVLPSGTDAMDWAIMNQRQLDDIIQTGETIKLPAKR